MENFIECRCESCGLNFLVSADLLDEIEHLTCPSCQEPVSLEDDDEPYEAEDEDVPDGGDDVGVDEPY